MENNIQIKFVPVEDCEFNEGQIPGCPSNPRTREEERQKKLEKSIEELPEMTVARACLVFKYNGKYVVIGGNRRLEAHRALNKKNIPVIEIPENTPIDKIRRIAIIDNESTGKTDWQKIKEEWNLEEIKDWGVDLPQDWNFPEEVVKEAKEDDFSEEDAENVETRVKIGEIWQLGEHRLMCGDSTKKEDVERLMNGEKADMVLSDPPYGMKLCTDYSSCVGSMKSIGGKNKIRGNKYEKVIGDNEDFTPELITTFFENFGYCKEVFLFGADYFAEIIPNKNDGSWLVWDKRKESQADAIGSEFELIWSKNRHKRRMLRFDWFGFLSSVNPTEARNRVHPTQKPTSLLENIINQWGEKAQIIVDLYGGSGSTLIACEQLSRKCYMMELSEHYCYVIIARWEKLTGKEAVKIYG